MRKLATVFFTCILFIANKAQVTFPEHGADWHYEVQNGGFTGPYYYTNIEIKYTRDTLFMGRNVKALSTTSCFRYPTGYTNSEQFIYTSNDSVFFYNPQTLNKFQLLYNFGSSVGQSWQICLQGNTSIDTINVQVDSIKNTLINSVSLKTLYVTYSGTAHQSFQFENHSVIYDRMGDIDYLFNFTSDIWPMCDGCSNIEGLLCYQDSTFSLYQPDTTKTCNYNTTSIKSINDIYSCTIYPNPGNGNFQVVYSANIDEIKITDMLGQTVYETKPNTANITLTLNNAGVYFVTLKTANGISTQKIIVQH